MPRQKPNLVSRLCRQGTIVLVSKFELVRRGWFGPKPEIVRKPRRKAAHVKSWLTKAKSKTAKHTQAHYVQHFRLAPNR